MSPIPCEEINDRLIQSAHRLRQSSHISLAIDQVLAVGEQINMPKATFIDNIELNQTQPDILHALGWTPAMMSWYSDDHIGPQHRDLKSCFSTKLPFKSSIVDTVSVESLGPNDRCIRNRQFEFGVCSNLIVPIHRPDGRVSLVGWMSKDLGTASSILDKVSVSLMAVAYAFSETLDRINNNTNTQTEKLSNRELQCVQLLSAGMSAKEIAQHLKISPHTVREYIAKSMKRLKAKNANHLVSLAWKLGIL